MFINSLTRFLEYYQRAMKLAEPSEDISKRISSLMGAITRPYLPSVNLMLYEKDRLMFGLLVSLHILVDRGQITSNHLHAMIAPVKEVRNDIISAPTKADTADSGGTSGQRGVHGRSGSVPNASRNWLTRRDWSHLHNCRPNFLSLKK